MYNPTDGQRDRTITTAALRAAMPLQTLSPGAEVFEYDTGNTYEVGVVAGAASAETATRVWTLSGSGGGGAWGKYVVWNGAAPGPSVLYATVTAALAAALADGCGPSKPCQILVMDGAYTESVVFRPGISVSAISGGTGPGGTGGVPSVSITGQHTVADVAGELAISGVALLSTSGIALTVGGTGVLSVKLDQCMVRTSAVNSRALYVTNSGGVTGLLRLDDCYVDRVAGAPAVPALESSLGVQAVNTQIFSGSTTELAVLVTSGSTNNAFVLCDITGSIQCDAGSCILRRTRVSCSLTPNCVGNGTWFPVEVESPLGLSFSLGATVTARQVQHQRSRAASGGSPVTLTSAMADTVTFSPGANGVMTATLPDAGTLADGVERTLVVLGVGIGTAKITVSPFAGNTINGGTVPIVLYEGATVTLRAARATLDWHVVASVFGTPGNLLRYPGGATTHAVASAAAAYTVDSTGGAVPDYLIGMTAAGARTVTLPLSANSKGTPENVRVIIVKDQGGGAGAGNITVSVSGGVETIDGAANYVISTKYDKKGFYCNGTAWFTL